MSKMTKAVASRVIACLLSTALFLGTTASGQSAAAAHKLPTIPFEKYKLKNGLEVILSEDHTLPLVSVNIWYHVGPANEKAGRTGFAHLFEHMMFEGSQHVGAKAHFGYLEGAGATEINGTTDFDRTNYFETVPSNQLDLALWLESDRMGYLLGKLDIQNLANQRDVVRNERRQSTENTPYGLVEEGLYPRAVPQGSSLLSQRDRLARRRGSRQARRCARIFPPILHAKQRHSGDRREISTRTSQVAGGKILRQHSTRPARTEDNREHAAHHFGAPRHGHRPSAIAAHLHGLDHARRV